MHYSIFHIISWGQWTGLELTNFEGHPFQGQCTRALALLHTNKCSEIEGH